MNKIAFAMLIVFCLFILSNCDNSPFQKIEDDVITQNAEITTMEEIENININFEITYSEYLRMLKEAEKDAINIIKESAEKIENNLENLMFEKKSIFLFWCEEYIKIYTLLSQKSPIEEIWDSYNDNKLEIELWKPDELRNMEIDD